MCEEVALGEKYIKFTEDGTSETGINVCQASLDLGECEVNNIVVTAMLDPKPRDVEENVQSTASDSRFRPWILVRFFGVKCTCLVFGSSGACVFVGIKKLSDVILVTQMLVMYIWKTKGKAFFVKNVGVKNIVGDGRLPGKLDLKRMAEENRHLCIYQPTVFPGLRYTGAGAVNAYASGCFVCAGQDNPDGFKEVVGKFKELALKYVVPKDT